MDKLQLVIHFILHTAFYCHPMGRASPARLGGMSVGWQSSWGDTRKPGKDHKQVYHL
jgi:hypothetical protein